MKKITLFLTALSFAALGFARNTSELSPQQPKAEFAHKGITASNDIGGQEEDAAYAFSTPSYMYSESDLTSPGCDIIPDFSFTVNGFAATFKDLSEDGVNFIVDSWNWDFGDGAAASTLENPSHTYTASGTYNVTLRVRGFSERRGNRGICNKNITKSVNIPPLSDCQITPKFQHSVNNFNVVFSNNTTTGPGTTITSWNWNFGDGTTSALQNSSHTYASYGTYNVTLVATGINGNNTCNNSTTMIVNVTNHSDCPITPNFRFTTNSYTANFTDLSQSGDSDFHITGRLWNFGDGTTSALINPVHTYSATNNTYNVTLKVTGRYNINPHLKVQGDGDMCSKSITKNVIVQYTPHCLITPNFQYSVNNLSVLFSNSSTTGPGTTITSWNWNFGDGTTSTLKNPSHTYASYRAYSVTLKATGRNGNQTCNNSITKIVSPTHPCPITPNFQSTTNSCTASFTDLSQSEDPDFIITRRLWDFGDGTTSTLSNPVHRYSTTNIYNVTLQVTGHYLKIDPNLKVQGNICSVSINKNVSIQCITTPCKITPDFQYNELLRCRIRFSDKSIADPGTTITSWNWNFGDGTVSTVQNPAHRYELSGRYNVSLKVTGINGTQTCIQETTKNVYVTCSRDDIPNRLSSSANNNNASAMQLMVYPNPSIDDMINLRFTISLESEVVITVSDMQGRVLSTLNKGTMGAGVHDVSLKTGLSQGMYLITLQTNSGVEHVPVLIQK